MSDFKIPSREEHDRLIRRLWLICIAAGCGIFVVTGGLMAFLFLNGYDTKKVLEVSTVAFQVLVLSYGMSFFVPAFLNSLMKVSLGVEMSRQGLEIGNKTASMMEKLDEAVEGRLDRADKLFDRLEKAVDEAESGELPAISRIEKTFREEMEKLRADIRDGKNDADAELNAALDEGERQAADVPEGT